MTSPPDTADNPTDVPSAPRDGADRGGREAPRLLCASRRGAEAPTEEEPVAIRVVVSGICGRMGSAVARLLAAEDDMTLVGGVENPSHENVGKRLCDLWSADDVELRVESAVRDVKGEFDVLLDFSTPEQAVVCARHAAGAGTGLVVGTTGLGREELDAVTAASASCPLVLAANTSLGVNLLFELTRLAAEALGDEFDVEIVEAHHRRKKDAPSGTALRLVDALSGGTHGAAPDVVHGRSGATGARPRKQIGIHSIRAGEIVGRHEVLFASEYEELVLGHTALSRDAFARGALRAARFVAGAKPGLYDMADVLGTTRRT